MTNKLREFVYLDEISINSHLSSIGKGIPEEVIQQSSDETETSGKAEAGIPGTSIGAGGERNYLDVNSTETRMDVSAPYRFQELRESIMNENINIYQEDNLADLSRGNVVELSGILKPMSLFKFEIVVNSLLDTINNEAVRRLDEIQNSGLQQAQGSQQEDIDEDDIEMLENILYLIQEFSGNKLSTQLQMKNIFFAVPLNRTKMRKSPAEAFFEERDYTIFGRVKRPINESWDPTQVTNILDKHVPEENAGEELRSDLKPVAEQLNIPMNEEDFLVSEPGYVIHPIAAYW
jgi:hypothetical protein